MKGLATIILLIALTGCASSGKFEPTNFDPGPNWIQCPRGHTVVVERRGGGRIRTGESVWHCVENAEF